MFAPVQDQVTLTCSVQEGYAIDWHVAFANGDEVFVSNGITLPFLLQQNFTLEGVSSNQSTLSLHETGNKTNNATNITCLALQETLSSDPAPMVGNQVQVIFYGTYVAS